MLDLVRRFFSAMSKFLKHMQCVRLKNLGATGGKSAAKASARKTPKVHLYEIDVKKYGFQNRKLILKPPLHSKWRQQTIMTIAQF